MVDLGLFYTRFGRMLRPLVCATLFCSAFPTHAGALEESVHRFVLAELEPRWAQAQVTVGTIDPRLTLAPCQRHQPYILSGSALWGRTAVGVRCVQGADWTITIPVNVTLHGPAWVATQTIHPGARISVEHFKRESVEVTRDPGTPVTDLAQTEHRTLTRRLNPGEVLRLEHLKTAMTVHAGDPVRIQITGRHFQIISDGVALAPAGEGQNIRIRTDNGRTLSGTLRGRTVEVLL